MTKDKARAEQFKPDVDDDPRSAGLCGVHGDYNGRFMRCPVCHPEQQAESRSPIVPFPIDRTDDWEERQDRAKVESRSEAPTNRQWIESISTKQKAVQEAFADATRESRSEAAPTEQLGRCDRINALHTQRRDCENWTPDLSEYQRGLRDGREEAAKILDEEADWHASVDARSGEARDHHAHQAIKLRRLAAAIRGQKESKNG